jgi:hypothetical protein
VSSFAAGWLMGLVTGTLLGVMATLTYQWASAYLSRRRHFEIDTSVERLRALGRHPSQAELQLLAEENLERYRRTR